MTRLTEQASLEPRSASGAGDERFRRRQFGGRHRRFELTPRGNPHHRFSGAFADPDRYVWEVAHNPDWTIEPDGSVRIQGRQSGRL